MSDPRVLIVDDEPIVRRAVCRSLSGLAHVELVEASCGNDAVQLLAMDLKRSQPLIKLVCLDWLMPRGSGRDVLRWMKSSGHGARVIIMTAYGSSHITKDLEGFSVSCVMTKPFDNISDVRDRVAALL
jgi:two-component system response regulator PilR (NtrC family)